MFHGRAHANSGNPLIAEKCDLYITMETDVTTTENGATTAENDNPTAENADLPTPQ